MLKPLSRSTTKWLYALGGEGDVGQDLPGGVDDCLAAPLDPYPKLEGREVGCSVGGHLGGETLGAEPA